MHIREAQQKDLEIILDIMNDAILNTTSIYDYGIRRRKFAEAWLDKKRLVICQFWFVRSSTKPLLMAHTIFSEPGRL